MVCNVNSASKWFPPWDGAGAVKWPNFRASAISLPRKKEMCVPIFPTPSRSQGPFQPRPRGPAAFNP